jgi:hypothetical protein
MRRLLGAGLLVACAGLAACSSGGGDGDDEPAGGPTARCVSDTRMDVYSAPGVVHVDAPGYKGPLANPPTYTVNPPSGGDHLADSVGPGVYAGLNVLPDGILMHSLEHGYVILWHRSDAPIPDITAIRDVQAEYKRDALVVERKDMPTPIAATAWKQRLLCDGADAKQLSEFVEKARNKAPEKVPH